MGAYVFCYLLGVNEWQRKFVRELAKILGLKVIALPHLDQYIAFDDKPYADEKPYSVTPTDFVNLIKNAEYVCTDSFHGTMFSLIYGKKFLTFRRFSENQTLSTNTRIESIASHLGITSRLVSQNESPSEILAREFDSHSVQEKLQAFRESSLKFLRESLEAQS